MIEAATTAGLPLPNTDAALANNPLANGVPANTLSDDQAQKVAEDFESFFLSQMLSHMFQGLGDDPLFGGGPGEAVFRSLMVQEYGTVLARNGGVGLSDAVTQEMLRLQEAN